MEGTHTMRSDSRCHQAQCLGREGVGLVMGANRSHYPVKPVIERLRVEAGRELYAYVSIERLPAVRANASEPPNLETQRRTEWRRESTTLFQSRP